MVKHFAGSPQSFDDVRLDLSGVPDFNARVYLALRKIGVGRTTSYGDLAARAGSPGAARAVGTAMRTNPFMLIVPCHRCLAAGEKIGGFTLSQGGLLARPARPTSPGGVDTKKAMLALEAHNLPYDADLAARSLAKLEPKVRAVIDRAGPVRLRIDHAAPPFEMLAKAILYQQLAMPAARAIHGRFVEKTKNDARVLVKLKDAELRACGISTPKMLSLRDLARRTVAGELPTLEELHAMTDEQIVESLTKVRGIGPWTVHMLLMFRLGRPDVWPVDDYGVRKGWAKTFGKRDLPKPKVLLQLGEKFKPWRSVLAWYMWRALE